MPDSNPYAEILDSINSASLDQAQRLFHGRGHRYPKLAHINIDWLAPVVLIILYSEMEECQLAILAAQLKKLIKTCRSVQVQFRCRPKSPTETLLGETINQCQVQENISRYQIHLGQSQNYGLFLDMKNGRQWVANNSKGKSVLNLFAYTCAFSVVAMQSGARSVVNIDNSRAPLNKGRENHRLNQLDTRDVRFESVDIFKSFSRIKKYSPYDLIICDPPSFQKGSVDIEKDYIKILRRLPQWTESGGLVMLCLNSPYLKVDFLFDLMSQVCPDFSFVERIYAPSIYQDAVEGKGLKILIFQKPPA